MTRPRSWVRTGLIALTLLHLTLASWILTAPRSFFDGAWVNMNTAYNQHLLLEFGAMNLALALVLGTAGRTMDPRLLRTALQGAMLFWAVHFVIHDALSAHHDSQQHRAAHDRARHHRRATRRPAGPATADKLSRETARPQPGIVREARPERLLTGPTPRGVEATHLHSRRRLTVPLSPTDPAALTAESGSSRSRAASPPSIRRGPALRASPYAHPVDASPNPQSNQ